MEKFTLLIQFWVLEAEKKYKDVRMYILCDYEFYVCVSCFVCENSHTHVRKNLHLRKFSILTFKRTSDDLPFCCCFILERIDLCQYSTTEIWRHAIFLLDLDATKVNIKRKHNLSQFWCSQKNYHALWQWTFSHKIFSMLRSID